jgi:hypothetical protein
MILLENKIIIYLTQKTNSKKKDNNKCNSRNSSSTFHTLHFIIIHVTFLTLQWLYILGTFSRHSYWQNGSRLLCHIIWFKDDHWCQIWGKYQGIRKRKLSLLFLLSQVHWRVFKWNPVIKIWIIVNKTEPKIKGISFCSIWLDMHLHNTCHIKVEEKTGNESGT